NRGVCAKHFLVCPALAGLLPHLAGVVAGRTRFRVQSDNSARGHCRRISRNGVFPQQSWSKVMRTTVFILTFLVAGLLDCAYASEIEPIRNLTMEQAVGIALTNNPHLAEAWARIESAEARAKSSGKFPNPEAVLRMESAPISSRTS